MDEDEVVYEGQRKPSISDVPSEEIITKIIEKLALHDRRMDAIETKQTDYLLIDMEELAKYVKIAIGNLKAIGAEQDLFDIKQVQKQYGDAHAFLKAFDQLQDAGVNARMTITVLFSIMNVMNRFEHKIIYNEEAEKKEQ